MKHTKKIHALVLAGVLLLMTCTGCGGTDNLAQDVAEADLPYGGTMITDTESYEVPIGYDRRYLSEDEVRTVADYFTALEQQDVTLFEKTVPAIYLDFTTQAMFQGMYGNEELLAQMSGTFAVAENEPYEITKLEFTDLNPENHTGTSLADLYYMLGEISGDADFSQRIGEDGKFLTYTIQTTSDSGTKTFTDQHLFLISLDGRYYVCA